VHAHVKMTLAARIAVTISVRYLFISRFRCLSLIALSIAFACSKANALVK
jgi:hypothetical protein